VVDAAALIIVAGAAIRFATLSTSIWFDEGVSVRDVSGSFGQMLHKVINHEASPPFYFICLWLWRHVFGSTALDLRSLSAVAGTLTIALAFYVASRRIGPRAGLILAVCVAVSPALVYASAEMRMYGVLVLITGIGFEAFLRVSESPNPRNLSVWAAASVLAVWTQYYAVLAVAPEAALLIAVAWRARPPSRGIPLAVGGVTLAGVPLLYLLPYQARHAFAYGSLLLSSRWQKTSLNIHTYPALSGVAQAIVVGQGGPATALLSFLVFLIVAVALGHLIWRKKISRRHFVWAVWLLTPAALTVVTLVDLHVLVNGRYLLPLWLPVGLGASYALAYAGRLGVGLAGLLVCVWLVVVVVSAVVPRFATVDDTRGAAQSLGVAARDRLIAISQPWDVLPFEEYRPSASAETHPTVRVRELDIVAMPLAGEPPPGEHERPSSSGLGPLPRGLVLAQVIRGTTFLIERFIASTPVSIRIDGRGKPFNGSHWRFLNEPAGGRMGDL
jgi:uncharacterized membrane protein